MENPLTQKEERDYREVLLIPTDVELSHHDVVQGYRDQMKVHKNDPKQVMALNMARDALIRQYPKPAAVLGGLVAVTGGQLPVDAPQQTLPILKESKDYNFEVSFKKAMTEFKSSRLELLIKRSSEGLNIAEGTFELQYEYKGKEVTVRTDDNFDTMINKHANQDGVYELELVMKQNSAGETED